MIKIGSLFSGIGGFELGLERAIPNSETIWQVEQNTYCQGILKKHWPQAKIYDDVRNITKDNVEPVDILCGGFPCQDISVAGKMGGLTGERSGLWWEMWRIIGELRPRIIVLENVANILRLGGREVLGSLAQIGYDAEWCIVSASQFGAPHKRNRWFCVAYPNSNGRFEQPRKNEQSDGISPRGETPIHKKRRRGEESGGEKNIWNQRSNNPQNDATNPNCERFQKQFFTESIDKGKQSSQSNPQNDSSYTNCERLQKYPTGPESTKRKTHELSKFSFRKNRRSENYWQENAPESPLCSVDDGIPQRVARLKALGNAIVPQCSEWIGKQIWNSGLLEEIA
jgi:DNA (cytosine-5)-methyltransferase 1